MSPSRWALSLPAGQHPQQRNIDAKPQVNRVADRVAVSVADGKAGLTCDVADVAHVAGTPREEGKVATWRDARCLTGRVIETTTILYDDYRGWCAAAGLEPLSRPRFMAALRALGHVTLQGMSRYRVGLCLRPAPDPDPDITAAMMALRRGGLFAGGEARPIQRREMADEPYGWCPRCQWPVRILGPNGEVSHAFCRGTLEPPSGWDQWVRRKVEAGEWRT